jgi:type I restriction enzyme M protein
MNSVKRGDLDDFVACYFGKSPPHGPLPGRGGEGGKSRHQRTESERFKGFTCDELLKRDKVNLDILRLKDEAREQFATIAEDKKIANGIIHE